jgi:hypothetical protein
MVESSRVYNENRIAPSIFSTALDWGSVSIVNSATNQFVDLRAASARARFYPISSWEVVFACLSFGRETYLCHIVKATFFPERAF